MIVMAKNDKRTLIIENIVAVDIDSTVKLAFRDGVIQEINVFADNGKEIERRVTHDT